MQVVKQVLSECDLLIIGIGSAQCSHTGDNPFTGGERLMMISEALSEEKIPLQRYIIVPLPDTNNNSLWVSQVRALCPPFDVVYTRNPLSKRLFEEAGISVREQPLFDRRRFSGTEIRRRMIAGESWEDLVPKGVERVIRTVDGVNRLKGVIGND